ncbi:MAG: helix-turn-helix transcriptional regulator [Fimbriimonadaceae bacterium]|nr:helix-turn-helix transcriptional regulator [Fimbriimonadaceae bacterium]
MRAERESKGLTQQQVAEQLGIPASALAKWERAERRVDIIDLRDYLLACGADFNEFTARWSNLAADLGSSDPAEVKLRKRARRQASPDERR